MFCSAALMLLSAPHCSHEGVHALKLLVTIRQVCCHEQTGELAVSCVVVEQNYNTHTTLTTSPPQCLPATQCCTIEQLQIFEPGQTGRWHLLLSDCKPQQQSLPTADILNGNNHHSACAVLSLKLCVARKQQAVDGNQACKPPLGRQPP